MSATLAHLDIEVYDTPIYYASRQLTSAKINYTFDYCKRCEVCQGFLYMYICVGASTLR